MAQFAASLNLVQRLEMVEMADVRGVVVQEVLMLPVLQAVQVRAAMAVMDMLEFIHGDKYGSK